MSEQRKMPHEVSREIVSRAWIEAQEFARSRGEAEHSGYVTGAFKGNVSSEITALLRRIERLEWEAEINEQEREDER